MIKFMNQAWVELQNEAHEYVSDIKGLSLEEIENDITYIAKRYASKLIELERSNRRNPLNKQNQQVLEDCLEKTIKEADRSPMSTEEFCKYLLCELHKNQFSM